MITTNHNRLYMILCLSLIVALIYSACATSPTSAPAEPPMVTEQLNNETPPLVNTYGQINGLGEVIIELPWQGRQLNIEERDWERT